MAFSIRCSTRSARHQGHAWLNVSRKQAAYGASTHEWSGMDLLQGSILEQSSMLQNATQNSITSNFL